MLTDPAAAQTGTSDGALDFDNSDDDDGDPDDRDGSLLSSSGHASRDEPVELNRSFVRTFGSRLIRESLGSLLQDLKTDLYARSFSLLASLIMEPRRQ